MRQLSAFGLKVVRNGGSRRETLWMATSTDLLDIAAAQVVATRSGARAEPSQSLRGRRSGPLAERTDIP
jgi:hypothetical protein